jgi:hypothetical protein
LLTGAVTLFIRFRSKANFKKSATGFLKEKSNKGNCMFQGWAQSLNDCRSPMKSGDGLSSIITCSSDRWK